MISLLIYLTIFVILAILIWWILQQVPLPEPLGKIVMIVFVVIGVIVLISLLLSVGGDGLSLPRLR
jgi:hypothetical protein